MISEAQGKLPEGHQWIETKSVSKDGLRVWNKSKDKGYTEVVDNKGNIVTKEVTLNQATKESVTGKSTDYNDVVVSKKEAEEVINELQEIYPGIKARTYKSSPGKVTIKIKLPVLESTKQNSEVKIDLSSLKSPDVSGLVKPTLFNKNAIVEFLQTQGLSKSDSEFVYDSLNEKELKLIGQGKSLDWAVIQDRINNSITQISDVEAKIEALEKEKETLKEKGDELSKTWEQLKAEGKEEEAAEFFEENLQSLLDRREAITEEINKIKQEEKTSEEDNSLNILDNLEGDAPPLLGNNGENVGENDSKGALRATTPKTDAREWDAEKEIKWLKSRLGKHIVENSKIFSSPEQLKGLVSEETYKMILEVGKNGKILQGLFTDAGLYLLDKAFTGTAYHEAFHVVFRLSLNNEQRTALLKEGRDKFKDELAEDATDIEVEELLADKFMEYVQAEQASPTISKKINTFFKKLGNTLRALFGYNNKVTVQGIFSDIELGVYKNKPKFKNTNLSEFTRFSTREDVRNNNSELFANNPDIRKDALDYMRELYFAIIDDIRINNPLLKNATDIEIIQKQGVNKLNNTLLTIIARDTKAKMARGSKEAKTAFIELFNELTAKSQNIKAVTDKKGNTTLEFKKPTQLLEQFSNYLAKDGIIISYTAVQGTKEDFNNNQITAEEEDNSLEEAWYRGLAKINPKDTLTQRLKRFFDTIPVYSSDRNNATPLSNYFGAAQTENGNEIFKYLIAHISGTKNANEMMAKLNKLKKSGKPYVSRIITELQNNPSIKSDLWIHVGSKSFMIYTFIQNIISKDFDGNITKNEFRISNANKKSLQHIVLEELVGNFLNQQNKLFTLHTKGPKKGKRNFEEINLTEFDNFKTAIETLKSNRGTDIRSIIPQNELEKFTKVLNKYGFLLSISDLNQLQSGETTAEQHKKFNNFIMKLENIVEQFNQNNNPFLFNQITSKKEKEDELESLVNAGIDKKNTRTTTIGKKQTIEKLAKALYPVYEGQVQAAFRNIENETVYNLQSSSFLTKKIRTFKNLKDLISLKKETKSDPLFANSPLLKDLENSSVYRENLQISILDGIRVKNRTTGVGYSDLSDIEYVKVGMALYRNGQENREYGHFKFPIPADSGTMPLIKLKKLSISEITDKLVEVARGEYLSIIKIKELRKTNPNADIFQVENFDAKSEQFNTLDFLNDLPINYDITENFEDIEKSIKDAIQDWMDKMLETEIKEFENKGIIIKDNTSLDLKFAEGVLPTGLTESSTDFFQKFILNSFYANTQLTTLFSGNPAFYKGAVNYQKRNKQTQAQVTYLDTLRPGVDAEYNVIYLKDVEEYTTEETLKALTALINESDLSPQKKKELIVQWTTNTHNITDGQTFISPSRYRIIWRNAHCRFYNF